jgi:hypothetical protein
VRGGGGSAGCRLQVASLQVATVQVARLQGCKLMVEGLGCRLQGSRLQAWPCRLQGCRMQGRRLRVTGCKAPRVGVCSTPVENLVLLCFKVSKSAQLLCFGSAVPKEPKCFKCHTHWGRQRSTASLHPLGGGPPPPPPDRFPESQTYLRLRNFTYTGRSTDLGSNLASHSCFALHCSPLLYIAWLCVDMSCVALRCFDLHARNCCTLPCRDSHCIALL